MTNVPYQYIISPLPSDYKDLKERKAFYLSLFPLSPVHNRCLASNYGINLHVTLSVRV